MNWIFIAFTAYFFYAISGILDKFLLKKRIPNPAAYTFYVGILSFFAIILIPFGVEWPETRHLIENLFTGAVFLLAVFSFISAVKKYEISRLATMIGGFTPIFIFILSYFFLDERLTKVQVLAFILLVCGGILISFSQKGIRKRERKYAVIGLGLAILSAFIFAVYYILAKFIFSNQPFLSAFFWSRMGSFLAAFIFLFFYNERKAIFATRQTAGIKGGLIFISNKILAAVAFILLNYAIFLGSATLVNAAQGIQYVFLFFLTIVLAKKFPFILKEKINRFILIQKFVSIIFISAGLFLLYKFSF